MLRARQPSRVPTSPGHAWPVLPGGEEPAACLKPLYSLEGTGVWFPKGQEGLLQRTEPSPGLRGMAQQKRALRDTAQGEEPPRTNNHVETSARSFQMVSSLSLRRETETADGGNANWGT